MTTAVPMRRRELHAATARSTDTLSGAQQMLMPFRHNKMAAVSAGFKFKPGFIYTQVRAISARINQNFDGWPSGELKKSYRSFLGKPVFVNHQNFDPRKARGKVVAARYVEAGDDKYVDVVQEIDAARYPKLGSEIISGGLDSVSMGVEAGFTICSYCGNKAIDTPDFCDHVRFHKGQRLRTASGEDQLVYEKCYKLGFFELSYVFDPADETAVVSRVIAAGNKTANPLPPLPEDLQERALFHQWLDEHPQYQEWLGEHQNVGPGRVTDVGEHEARIDHLAGMGKMFDKVIDWAYPEEGGVDRYHPEPEPTEQEIAERFDTPHERWEHHHQQHHHQPKPYRYHTPKGLSPSMASIEDRISKLAYGEVEAPEDVDTLRNEDQDDNDDFKHYVESPKELQGPDMDQTKRLDRVQEQEGLDSNRNVEDVENIGGHSMPQHTSRRRQSAPFADPRDAIDEDRPFSPQEEKAMKHQYREPAPMLIDRQGRRYYAADDEAPPEGGDPGGDPSGGGGQSDEELIQEAEQDLEAAEDEAEGGGDDIDSDEGGTDDDYSDEDEGDDEDADEDADEDGTEDDEDSDGGSGDLPPWLQNGDTEEDSGPPPPSDRESRRVNRRSSTQKKRRTRKGAPMSLANRQRVASAQWPRRHYADDSGHTDGGPYHTDDNDQGEQEEVFISQTPGSEPVAAPVPGDGTISNTENNLVARIQRRNAELRRDIIAYEQITGRRVQGYGAEYGQGPTPAVPAGDPGTPGNSDPLSVAESPVNITGRRRRQAGEHDLRGPGTGPQTNPYTGGPIDQTVLQSDGEYRPTASRRHYADDGEWPNPGAQSVSGTETPETVDPQLSGTDQQGLSGDFDSVALDSAETQPKDASRRYFADFDRWVAATTGKTARQHANPNFIRRTAARYCQAKGIPVEAMFPTLGNVLREARRNESGTNRRSKMRRRADDKLDVAAPQDRIDVEAPVSGTTDADAQASQFDLGDFGNNAGDNIADPDLSPDSQIWAPGEGDSSKTSNRKADGMAAVRYAEAYITAGLAPNTSEEKWKIAGLAQTMRHGTIVDRTRLLDAINAQRAASVRRTAGVNRGGGSSLPRGVGQRQLTAGTAHEAANDISSDMAMWFK